MSNEQFETDYGKQGSIIFEKPNQSEEIRKSLPGSKNVGGAGFPMTSPRGPPVAFGASGPQSMIGKIGANSPFKKNVLTNNVGNNNQATSPADRGGPNLSGLVSVKAYEKIYTSEIPTVTCNLLPTQLDHLKVLYCDQDNKNHPKLTQEASEKLEIEK